MLALAEFTELHDSLVLFALLCGLLAAAFSFFAGLAKWWLLIQSIFVPPLVLMLAVELPPGLFLANCRPFRHSERDISLRFLT